MAFIAPALAAIGGGSAAVGALTLAGAAAAGYTAYSGIQSEKKREAEAAKKEAASAAKPAPVPETPPQSVASQPAKAPDRSALNTAMAAAARSGGSLAGNSSTFLTGPTGVDKESLRLGKNTLLGQ